MREAISLVATGGHAAAVPAMPNHGEEGGWRAALKASIERSPPRQDADPGESCVEKYSKE